MNYFKLYNCSNSDIVGIIPQSITAVTIGDMQKDFIPFEGKIVIPFKLPEPVLRKKTIQTSLINSVPIPSWFLIIDDEFLSFIKKYKIGNYQSWKIKVWQNKKLIDKYNLFFINDTKQDKYIDFSKSDFFISSSRFDNQEDRCKNIKIENYKDYLSKRKELIEKKRMLLLPSKIVFNLKNVNEDIFRIINAPLGGYYFSEKLKRDIEKKGFTGMEFKKMDDFRATEVKTIH